MRIAQRSCYSAAAPLLGAAAVTVLGPMLAAACEPPRSKLPAPSPSARSTQPPDRPSAAPQIDPGARRVLEAAAEALSQAATITYRARASGPEGSTELQGQVFMQRLGMADGPSCKIAVSARLAPAGESKDGGDGSLPEVARVGYDGATARRLQPADRVVFERSMPEPADLRRLFGAIPPSIGGPDDPTLNPGDLVLWEFADRPPLALPSGASLRGEPPVEVDGRLCDVIFVASDPARPGAGVRYFVAKDDRVPRRVEWAERQPADAPDGSIARRVDFTEVRLNVPLADSSFVIDAPEGFKVRPAFSAPRTSKSRQEQAKRSPVGETLAIGTAAPAFSLKDADGKTHSLEEYKGKVVLLDFWGSWCPPCRAAMPGVQRIHEKFAGKPVVVIGLNFEQSPKAKPAEYMKTQGFTYQLLLEAQTIAPAYRVSAWPTFYLIDQQGLIVWAGVGFSNEHEKEIASQIEDLLVK